MKVIKLFVPLSIFALSLNACKKESSDGILDKEATSESLKESFDRQSASKGNSLSFNDNFKSKILWNTAEFRGTDTAIVKVELLNDVKVYTNDSIPVDMSRNLIVKATKSADGNWQFVKVIYLPEQGKDLPNGFTGKIISEGFFNHDFLISKYYGGQVYFSRFNSNNTWMKDNLPVKLKAGTNDGFAGCEPEEETVVIGYVEGYINTVWHKPKYPNNDRCLDGGGSGDPYGPIVPVGGSGGSQGTPDDLNSLSITEMVEFANLELEYRSRMGTEELAIYEKMSTKNKFAYLTNAKQAEQTAKAKFSSSTLYNGKGDAFRHAYFHALNSITIGSELSKKLGDAHEIGAPSLEKEMDLYNNALGRSYLQNSHVGESPQEFISRSITGGDLKYLSPLGLNGVVIPNVTKLIPTNK
ncbi:DUF6973 domain-containing protein [Sphingobacterium sp. ML3W]|uniref:DUF6973 domain-containing protein n=1 Tax=Sphingobacterium sp. ML3W TaxID=1538644 RepID=UPI00068DFF35|nr:hypothetical protein [Sphingobacterium sp. ML3W]